MNMIKCPYCGADLPEGAHFCPVCAKSLTEKSAPSPAVVHKKPKLWILAAIVVVAAVVIGILISNRPKTFDDKETASLIYETGGRTYHLILRNSVGDDFHWRDPQPLYERKVPADLQFALPLQLYVYDEETGENAASVFYDLLDSSFLNAEGKQGSEIPQLNAPTVNPGFANATFETDVVFNSECTAGRLTWTFLMKNGDTLILHEAYQIAALPEAFYSYENTSLTSLADVQAILDSFPEGDETQITIVLAPALYEGTLSFGNLTVTLQGTEKDGVRTQIDGCITITDSNNVNISICEIDFIGHGEGSAIIGYGTFFADYCTFTDFDIAIDGRDGSWPIPYSCKFENCRIGFYINSSRARGRTGLFMELTFLNNETAVQFIRMPSDEILYFTDCVFEGNGTDLDIQSGNKVEIQ